MDTDIIDVTLSLDTNAYASGDVLAATQEIAWAMRQDGGAGMLQTLIVFDEDDQTAAGMDFVFFDSNVSLGSENSAPSITDANARQLLGIVTIQSTDWIDLGGAKVVSLQAIDLPVKALPTSRSLYFAVITRGSPTQTASGIRARFGFVRH